jgi:hypothetical protein
MNASKPRLRWKSHFLFCLFLSLSAAAPLQLHAQTAQTKSPSDTVKDFYKAMREKRFREAFAMSIFKPAIEPLSAAEFEDLKVDFERLAATIPEKVQISGEQVSGEEATVFMKMPNDSGGAADPEPVSLILRNGVWIIGDPANEAIVKQSGKEFFFNARLDTHHGEVQSMLLRISIAQAAYAQQHSGLFADMPTLIQSGLVPKDLESTESTGYRFHISLASGAKAYTAGAEPAIYGRSGKLSFYMDSGGIKSADLHGKQLLPNARQ